MPFTLSHAVAVLPLRRVHWLAPGALVIGSWTPDLPYYVPGLGGSRWTHAASGPVSVDLLLGLAVCLVFRLILQRPLTDLAPGWLRDRLPEPAPVTRRWLTAVAVSVVLGSATHVAWDTFTHPGRWGTTHVVWLTAPLGPLPLLTWLQFGSGALGLAGLAMWLVVWARRAVPRPRPPRTPELLRRLGWAVVGAATGLVAAVVAVHGDGTVEQTAFAVATTGVGAAMAAGLLVCLAWHVGGAGPRRAPSPG